MKKYTIFILVISMVISSCKSNKFSRLTNDMVFENNYFTRIYDSRINCTDKITLKPDSTFTLKFNQGVVNLSAKGRWYVLSKDSLMFESRNFPVFEKLLYGKQKSDTIEKRKVKVMAGGDKLKFPKRINKRGIVLEYTVLSKKK